jgi:hypothetical protein
VVFAFWLEPFACVFSHHCGAPEIVSDIKAPLNRLKLHSMLDEGVRAIVPPNANSAAQLTISKPPALLGDSRSLTDTGIIESLPICERPKVQ